MKGNFDQCLEQVLKHEGGYVDHPEDPGGRLVCTDDTGDVPGAVSQALARPSPMATGTVVPAGAVSPAPGLLVHDADACPAGSRGSAAGERRSCSSATAY